jgi:2-hydroxy-3-keto-5-methylthiopentenyl-1-phosphate phosphatase
MTRRDNRLPTPDTRHPTPVVFSDFDGTITQADVTDLMLEEFAEAGWREIEQEWVAGRMGSRECLRRQMALVRAPARELDALIDSVPLDRDFAAFHALTRERGIPFYVVSDGFDYVIGRVLRNCGVDGELLNGSHLFSSALRVSSALRDSGALRVHGGGGLEVDFPHWPEGCAHGCATCKPEVMRRVRGAHRPVIFIGDGLSDRFAVEQADVIFAKDKLAGYCREHGMACHPFETFADIQAELELRGILGRQARAEAARPVAMEEGEPV